MLAWSAELKIHGYFITTLNRGLDCFKTMPGGEARCLMSSLPVVKSPPKLQMSVGIDMCLIDQFRCPATAVAILLAADLVCTMRATRVGQESVHQDMRVHISIEGPTCPTGSKAWLCLKSSGAVLVRESQKFVRQHQQGGLWTQLCQCSRVGPPEQ